MARMPQHNMLFILFHIKGFMMSVCLITSDVKLDHLVKVVSVGFLHNTVAIVTFIVNKYLGRP